MAVQGAGDRPVVTRRIDQRIRRGEYSEFFRTRGMEDFWFQLVKHFHEIQAKNLPDLKIIVVGCSSGEEAYSVAMLAKQLGLDRRTRVKTIGIDRNPALISQARIGIFRKSDYGTDPEVSLPPEYKQYFVGLGEKGQDRFRLRKEIREAVDLIFADILVNVPEEAKNAEVVLAHNLIASDRREQESVLSACVKLARKGSLLFINNGFFSLAALDRLSQEAEIIFMSESDIIYRVK
jgi:chemotaxis methyl-accepting protein methylase